jgi:hypothetical protein
MISLWRARKPIPGHESQIWQGLTALFYRLFIQLFLGRSPRQRLNFGGAVGGDPGDVPDAAIARIAAGGILTVARQEVYLHAHQMGRVADGLGVGKGSGDRLWSLGHNEPIAGGRLGGQLPRRQQDLMQVFDVEGEANARTGLLLGMIERQKLVIAATLPQHALAAVAAAHDLKHNARVIVKGLHQAEIQHQVGRRAVFPAKAVVQQFQQGLERIYGFSLLIIQIQRRHPLNHVCRATPQIQQQQRPLPQVWAEGQRLQLEPVEIGNRPSH